MVYLFEIGQESFARFVRELRQYGIQVDPSLELRRGEGMWCRYDIEQRQIYLSVPNTAEPGGKLYLLYLRSLLRCTSNGEFLRISEFLIPYFVAHELGHHLRHRYGRFSNDAWHEEQVANQLAIALNKPRLDMKERQMVTGMIERAVEGLAEKLDVRDEGVASYRNLWEGLHSAGAMGSDDLSRLRLIRRIRPETDPSLVIGNAQLAVTLQRHLQKRRSVIDQINTDYADDMVRYLYFHLHWLALELGNHEHEYVMTFAHDHLGLEPPLLPVISLPRQVSAGEVLACFKAHQQTACRSEALSAYFYRRYLGLLIILLQELDAHDAAPPQIPEGTGSMLQSCILSEPDFLRALMPLAPACYHQLFPHNIPAHRELGAIALELLPTDTDRRLAAHAQALETSDRAADAAAANTLELLERLHRISVFDALPAEVWLELVHRFLTVRLEEGDTLIRKDETNHDVYVLIEGELAVFIAEDGRGQCVGRLGPGELIGEIAFLTRTSRQATVRATKPSECLVLHDLDLRILAFKYPDMLVTMGKTLAQRLARMNQTMRAAPSKRAIEGLAEVDDPEEERQWPTSRH